MQNPCPKRLLIITQKMDKSDALLGFFHRWIEEFAKHLEVVEVICLYEGEHDFQSEKRNPSTQLRAGAKSEKYDNITIYSLGKESGYSKSQQLFRFWKFCLKLAPRVDGVFVHMNAIWVVLGWPIFILFGKKIVFWITHYRMGFLANIAGLLAGEVVTATAESAHLKTKKATVLGHGIDTQSFRRLVGGKRNSQEILVLGRISRMKNIDVAIRAFVSVIPAHPEIRLSIVGDSMTADGAAYLDELKKLSRSLGAAHAIRFLPSVSYARTLGLYNSFGFLVNATETGSLDKVPLEAMASELPALVSNRPYERFFSPDLKALLFFRERDSADLTRKLGAFLSLAPSERERIGKEVRELVVRHHSLARLVPNILSCF